MKTITVCPFFCHVSLIHHNDFELLPHYCIYKNVSLNIDKSIPLYGCSMIFFFLNPFIYRQSFGLFPFWGLLRIKLLPSVQFSSSVVSNSLRPMNRSARELPVHHKLPEFTQTHAHRVGDYIQPSHPLSSPSPPAPNPSQHQGLFQRVNSSHEVAKVLEFQLQHQSFQ